jgi:hypothetical protein
MRLQMRTIRISVRPPWGEVKQLEVFGSMANAQSRSLLAIAVTVARQFVAALA